MMTDHDQAALQHYTALIEARYPPALAVALAAARYASHIQSIMPLPQLAEVLEMTATQHPELKREARRTAALIGRQKEGR